jgi:hypothetical protein
VLGVAEMFGKGGVHEVGTVVFTVIAWGRRASISNYRLWPDLMQAPREKPLCYLQKLRCDPAGTGPLGQKVCFGSKADFPRRTIL